jgi:hypothetical protein
VTSEQCLRKLFIRFWSRREQLLPDSRLRNRVNRSPAEAAAAPITAKTNCVAPT